jgi:hypothetical protein
MTEPGPIKDNDIVSVEGNTLNLKVGEYRLSITIEGPEVKPSGRLRLEGGKTLFDLVFDAARAFVDKTGKREFSAADLYHTAKDRHPDLDIRRNSWNAHVMSSASNHPSYRHYTSHRNYFRYHGRGKYSLEPSFTFEN